MSLNKRGSGNPVRHLKATAPSPATIPTVTAKVVPKANSEPRKRWIRESSQEGLSMFIGSYSANYVLD